MDSVLLGLVIIGVIGWFWQNTLRAKEAVCAVCCRLCQTYGYQLLDDTVTFEQLRFVRNDRGRVSLARYYTFRFSLNGTDCYKGTIYTVGTQVKAVSVPEFLIQY